MTRKDYDAIAARIKSLRNVGGLDATTLDIVTSELSDVMAEGNARFNRLQFYTASGTILPHVAQYLEEN